MSATHPLPATAARWRSRSSAWTATTPSCSRSCSARSATVAEKAAFTLGSYVEDFEADFAAYCEADEAVGVASGTDALAMSLRALGIGPGDEVIVPAQHVHRDGRGGQHGGRDAALRRRRPGHRPDHGRDRRAAPSPRKVRARHARCTSTARRSTWTRSWRSLARPGSPWSRTPARRTAPATAAGASGALGDIGCFSFYPAKNLGAWGDGGGVVTNRPELADRVRLLRSHGERPRYRHRMVGTTARLDALQAAILRVKLRHLDGWNAHRRRAAAELRRALQGTWRRDARRSGGRRRPRLPPVRRADRRPRPAARAPRRRSGIASAVHYPVPDAPHGGLRAARLRAGLAARRRGDGRAGVLAADVPRHRRRADQRHRRGGGAT